MPEGTPLNQYMSENNHSIKATPIPIDWHPGLPVFASESFLQSVSDEYGWLGGRDAAGTLRCILPYTIVRKFLFRMVRFRVETIYVGTELELSEEKSFLNSVVDYFRSTGADIIIPATTNTIFRTFPDGAKAAPYGTYVIDLRLPEEILWRNIDRVVRQNIGTSQRANVTISDGMSHLEAVYDLIRDTFGRSKMSFMSIDSFRKYVRGLGENGRIMIADHNGIPQSYVVFAFSKCCAYAIYAGNAADQHQGANKLLYWEAIRQFKQMGIERYDFVGARVDPPKGSKQESINALKRRFGAKLIRGYMWKYPLRPVRALAYTLAVRFQKGGDIVDAECHKMEAPTAS